MSTMCIEINPNSVVLLRGGKEVEAHASTSKSTRKWIDSIYDKYGRVYTVGWYNLKSLEEKEKTNGKK